MTRAANWSGIVDDPDAKETTDASKGHVPAVPAAAPGMPSIATARRAQASPAPATAPSPSPSASGAAGEPVVKASESAGPAPGTSIESASPGDMPEGASAERLPPAAYERNALRLHYSVFKVWKGNPRHTIDSGDIDELARSLQEMGQESAIQVVPDPEHPGHYLILCGQRRWMATRDHELNDGFIYAVVRHDLKTEAEMYAVAVLTQAHTKPLNMLDYAISLTLSSETGVRVLAKALGKDKSEVSRLQQIGRLPNPVIAVLRRSLEKFSITFAYEVVLVQKEVGDEKAIEFAEKVLTEDLTVKDAKRVRESLLSKDGAPARRPATTWSLQVKNSFGSVRVSEATRDMQLDLKNLPEEHYRELRALVDRLVSTPPEPTQ
jgi:ParB/RepB/Spo0J family partition protein